MKKIIPKLPEYDFITYQELATDDYAVLLGKGNKYSVCRMQPKRRVAMAPNYNSNGYGLICGPLSTEGLAELLQWTNREGAITRYRDMTGLSENVVPIFPTRRPPE